MEPKDSLLLQSHDLLLVPITSQMNRIHTFFLKWKKFVGNSWGVNTEKIYLICDCMYTMTTVSAYVSDNYYTIMLMCHQTH
jgi:hypothetical protein